MMLERKMKNYELEMNMNSLSEWKYISEEFYRQYANLPVVKIEWLIKVLLIMWQKNAGAFWEIEDQLLEDYYSEKNADFSNDNVFPQAMTLAYTYKLCVNTIEGFENKLVKLFEQCQTLGKFKTQISAENFIKSNVLSINREIYTTPDHGELAIKDIANNNERYCTGGCLFKLIEEEKNFYDLSTTRIYKAVIKIKAPFQAATTLNVVNKTPGFPLGEIYGKYEKINLNTGDCEGGLRTLGKYKANTEELPLITFVTVVYNRVDTILRCMESVWAQNYPNIEYIIIDGKSNDGTLDIIKENADKIDYYISQSDSGIYNAMNKGISVASGEFICFMNSDDVCTPNAAAAIVNSYKKSNAKLINGCIYLRNDQGKIFTPKAVKRKCIADNVMRYEGIYHQALYCHAETFEKIGGFDETYRGASDLKWNNACKNSGYKIELIDDVTAIFSLGGFSDANKQNTVDETCRIFSERYDKLPKEIVKQLYFLYKRQPFTRREIIPAYNKIKYYLREDASLRKWMYEISLYMIIEELDIVINKYKTSNSATETWGINHIKQLLHRESPLKGKTVDSLIDLYRVLDNELNRSSSMPDIDITMENIHLVCLIKKYINCHERKIIYTVQYKKEYGFFTSKYKYFKDAIEDKVIFNSLEKMSRRLEKEYLES